MGGGGGECHTTRRKWQANTCFVGERRGNAGVTVIKRVLPCMAKQVLICRERKAVVEGSESERKMMEWREEEKEEGGVMRCVYSERGWMGS